VSAGKEITVELFPRDQSRAGQQELIEMENLRRLGT